MKFSEMPYTRVDFPAVIAQAQRDYPARIFCEERRRAVPRFIRNLTS